MLLICFQPGSSLHLPNPSGYAPQRHLPSSSQSNIGYKQPYQQQNEGDQQSGTYLLLRVMKC